MQNSRGLQANTLEAPMMTPPSLWAHCSDKTGSWRFSTRFQRYQWTTQLRAHPLVVRYIQYMENFHRSAGEPTIPARLCPEPWMAQAMKMTAMLQVLSGGYGYVSTNGHSAGASLEFFQEKILFALFQAKVFLWNDDMLQQTSGITLPPHHVEKTALPFPFMFFVTESGFTSTDPETEERRMKLWELIVPMAALTPQPHIRRYDDEQVTGIGLYENSLVVKDNSGKELSPEDQFPGGRLSEYIIPLDKLFPSDFSDPYDLQVIEPRLAQLAFLSSEWTDSTPVKPQRALRRQVEAFRIGKPLLSAYEDANVILLRRPAVKQGDKPGKQGSIQFQYRFPITGHIRNQTYGPKNSLRRLQWIPGYIKGPAGALLKENTYHVIR